MLRNKGKRRQSNPLQASCLIPVGGNSEESKRGEAVKVQDGGPSSSTNLKSFVDVVLGNGAKALDVNPVGKEVVFDNVVWLSNSLVGTIS